jgi:hypothetical protein
MEIENRENNIFYNVIRNETSLTEVFCNLMQYKAFRDLFLNIVNQKRESLKLEKLQVASIKYNNFSTEKAFKEEDTKLGRGDLILEDRGSEYIFELKIERYTKLTSNQPEGYLKYLKGDDSKLFFIIPKDYMHKDDIYTRWNEETGYAKERIKNHIIFWEDIIKYIRQNELDKLNSFINEFCNILDYRWFYYPNIKFLTYEIEILFQKQKNKKEELLMLLDANIPKIVSKLFKIVEEAKTKLEIKKDDNRTEETYGYAVKNKDISEEVTIWFGVDYEIWEKCNFPLTIQIYSDDEKQMDKIKSLNFSTTFQYEDEIEITFIGLEKNVFENQEENIIEVFVDKINKIIEKLKRT